MHQTPSIPAHAFSAFSSVASRSRSAVLSIDLGRSGLQSFHSGVGLGISHRPIWGVHDSIFQLELSAAPPTHLFAIGFVSQNIFVSFSHCCVRFLGFLTVQVNVYDPPFRPWQNIPNSLDTVFAMEASQLPSSKIQHWKIFWSFHTEIACCKAALFQGMLEVLAGDYGLYMVLGLKWINTVFSKHLSQRLQLLFVQFPHWSDI